MKKIWANDTFKCRKFTAVVNALNFFLFFIVSLRTITQGTIKYPNKRNHFRYIDKNKLIFGPAWYLLKHFLALVSIKLAYIELHFGE